MDLIFERLARTALAVFATVALATTAMAQTTYLRGNSADPETLDPQKTSNVAEGHILRDAFEGLVVHNMKGQPVPGVAEKWEVSDDGKLYRFTLRANAKWSNGDPVKASDFVYSYRRNMNPATGSSYANLLYVIKNAEKAHKGEGKIEDIGVSAPDDRTVEFHLENPTPQLIEVLTHLSSLPVHPPSVEKFGADWVKPANIVSNGAYKITEVVPNSHITAVKNPHFHDAANVKIEEVKYIPHPDLAAMVRRYQAGELHSTDDIPADQIKALKQRLGDQVRINPYIGTFYLVLNSSKAPFSDARVRHALAMVIDREFIADQIWNETMEPAYSFMAPGIGNYGKTQNVDWKDLSPIDREEKAKALLKEAGYGPDLKPLKVEIRYNTTDNNRNTVVAVASQWKALGVETTFVNTDSKTHFSHLRNGGDFDAARYGWIANPSDPTIYLFLLKSDNKGFNAGKYSNPEFDKLLDQAATLLDLDKRAEVFAKAEALLLKDLPWIPVMHYRSKNLISPKLVGWESNPRGVYPTRFLALKQ